MDRMFVGEPDVDGNRPQKQQRELISDSMALPTPYPHDNPWTPSAAPNSSPGSEVSPLSGLVPNGTNNARSSYSTASSCEESWAGSAADHDEGDREMNWDEWEQGSASALIIPKNEPADEEDMAMSEFRTATMASPETGTVVSSQKRGRGRPRKNPIPAPTNGIKVTKGRSKTGCITCRKRKKKCDEAKPGCMNCEKNSVLCEGYNEKHIWKSGKERAEEGRANREALPLVTLPALIQGFDTPEDKLFLGHYLNRLSNVLTVEPESQNAFKNILLNLATSQQGLLHSILSISSIHIDLETSYGEALLKIHPAISKESLQRRSEYHTEAQNCLLRALRKSDSLDKDSSEYRLTLAALYGQILCLVVQNLIEGNSRGEHRMHLKAYQTLIRESPPESMQLYTFITEFFQYHICADDLLWHPESDSARLSLEESGNTPSDDAPRLVGVTDGLFHHLRDITTLRNKIRNSLTSAKGQPAVSYAEVFQANDITLALQSWSPPWSRGDNRAKAGELYKLTLWIYSFRTVYPPATGNADFLMGGSSLSSYMQDRRSSIASSSGHLSNGCSEDKQPFERRFSCSPTPNPSRTNSIHEEDGLPTPAPTHGTSSSRPPSPPPSRRPSQDDKRVTASISDALQILESFEPSDQCQTLLLIPCLLIGTACFDAALRPRIRAAVQTIREYTGLRNADRVQEVLNETWNLMDIGDWVAVWDWQSVARGKGLDFLCS